MKKNYILTIVGIMFLPILSAKEKVSGRSLEKQSTLSALPAPTFYGINNHFEFENLPIADKSSELVTFPQETGSFASGTCSNDAQLLAVAGAEGSFLEFHFDNLLQTSHKVELQVTKGGDFGTIAFYVNGNKITTFDAFSTVFTNSGRIDLGTFTPVNKSITLKVVIEGKNPSSSGYVVGLDYVKLSSDMVTNLNFGVKHADVSIIDIDNDGYRDILISGENDIDRISRLFKNNGDGTFSTYSTPFDAVTRTTIDWNDINQDGKPDMIVSGFPSGAGDYAKLFTTDGAGNFTLNPANPIQLAPGCGFADLNNDGYTDFYVFGNVWEGKAKIYFNDKMGGFTESAQFEAYEFGSPEVMTVDFDNDGDLDLFVVGDRRISADPDVWRRFSRMFVNDGNGNFTEQNLGIFEKGIASASWGDVNGDGWLDLLIYGEGWLESGEDSNDIVRVYINNANGTFTAGATFSNYYQISTGDGCRFADWDNDGDLDIIITGWDFMAAKQQTHIFLNDGNAVFTAYSGNDNLPGVSDSSIEVADLNNDGKLDLVITGFSNNEWNGTGSGIAGLTSLVIYNTTTNTNNAPSAPSNLLATGNTTALTLSWDASTDDSTPQNSLTYNIYLKDVTNAYYYASLSDETTGKLLVQRMGNVQLNKSWTIKDLPDGIYTWGVQAIDNSFAASTFATGTFVIAGGTLPVTLQSFAVNKEVNGVNLKWETVSEENNNRYEIYKSANGKDFAPLHTEIAKGAGNYSFFDTAPFAGINYYRLSQIDNNGKETVLATKAVEFGVSASAEATVYPNPTSDKINISLKNYHVEKLSVTLTDISGKVLYQEQTQNTTNFQLDYKPVPGIYFIHLTGKGLNKSMKLIVK